MSRFSLSIVIEMIRAYDVSSNTNQKQAQRNRQHPIRKQISLNALTFMLNALRKFPSTLNSSVAHILLQRVWYTEQLESVARIRGLFSMKAHCQNAHFNSSHWLFPVRKLTHRSKRNRIPNILRPKFRFLTAFIADTQPTLGLFIRKSLAHTCLTCAGVYEHSLQRSTKLDESRHHAARNSETLSNRIRANDYTLGSLLPLSSHYSMPFNWMSYMCLGVRTRFSLSLENSCSVMLWNTTKMIWLTVRWLFHF